MYFRHTFSKIDTEKTVTKNSKNTTRTGRSMWKKEQHYLHWQSFDSPLISKVMDYNHCFHIISILSRITLKSSFYLCPKRKCLIVKPPSIVFATYIDWPWTYLLYHQPNPNRLCMRKHFGPLGSVIICFSALFNLLLARNKVPTKFHRALPHFLHTVGFLSLTSQKRWAIFQ